MALRPFITAGVAFATAGVVAATVAIAPPMSPGDVKVAKDTQVALNADLTDLINTYFGEFPGGDGAGTIHAAGVIQQLLQNANVNDPRGTEVIDSFFEAGLSDVVRLLLTRDNVDPISRDQINIFFNSGFSDLVRYRLLMYQADPTLRAQINTFFGDALNSDGSENIAQNGVQGLFYKFLVDRGLSVDQRRILDTFWNAPTIYNSQAVPVMIPNEETPDPDDVIQAVDGNGNPIFVGNSNPARRGSFGVLYNTIKGTGLSPSQQVLLDEYWDGGAERVARNTLLRSTADPTQQLDIVSFFDGGISENFRWRLVAGAADQRSKDLWNEFFDNGIDGVARYLLVGPVPEVESPPVPAEVPEVPEANALSVADVEAAPEEGADVTEVENKVAAVEAAPAVAAAAPVQAAAPAPEATSTVKEEAPEDETATAIKTGNKVEPVIILPGGVSSSGARGGGAWGWKGVADRVNGFVKGVQNATGGAPAADSGGADAGDAGADSGE